LTTKLKCLLLDDELPGLAYLKMLCGQIDALEIVKAFDNPHKLLDEIPTLDFDLLISDIEMPGIDGLAVAKSLNGKLVIFTTAYKDFAADAFDIDAVDYITKPVKAERLHKAIEKAIERFDKATVKKFAQFNTDKGKALLHFDRVVLIRTAKSDSRDKEVLLNDGQMMLLKNISFDQLLQELPAGFCRVNKQEIIALSAVKFFAHNEIALRQNDGFGKPIPVSLNEKYRPDFLQKTKV
jgi:DNA-binding LytR/AlgR family response regulator